MYYASIAFEPLEYPYWGNDVGHLMPDAGQL